MGRRSGARGFLPLHPLEFRILMALLDGPSYGTAIVEEIEAREAGRTRLYPANLFRRIRDLLSRELLEECPAPKGADPRRTYVRLTRTGRAVARAEARRLRELVREAVRHDLLPGG
ncbi:MAG TPA: helix-turn-helix transcriptional regulator [Longimicrobiales bacterium]|nr:helix-turn-helix transcriptional regulator [Longimicrobiales bacterium]